MPSSYYPVSKMLTFRSLYELIQGERILENHLYDHGEYSILISDNRTSLSIFSKDHKCEWSSLLKIRFDITSGSLIACANNNEWSASMNVSISQLRSTREMQQGFLIKEILLQILYQYSTSCRQAYGDYNITQDVGTNNMLLFPRMP